MLTAVLALSLGLGLMGAGCRLMQSAAKMPAQTVRAVKGEKVIDPVEVQQKLLRFADEFSAQMISGIDKLRRGTNAIALMEAMRWKIAVVTESCSIASGQKALANLLDMTAFVTVTRMSVEDHWQPKVYGASAQPMLEICRSLETNIWKLAATVLKAEQQEELRQAIAAWVQQHPVPGRVIGTRAVSFAMEVGRVKQTDATASDSVFSLLGLDPLSGLDPATREIAQTRMLAERALSVTQWMPSLLRWQIELLSLNTLAAPEVQQLVTNSTQLTASVDRFARVAEQLPGHVSTEREEILKALQSQEKGLAALSEEFRRTLNAGSQMSTSLNTTLTTFDALMKRFGVGETNSASPPATNSHPFNILDYAQTAGALEKMARQLTELLRTVEETTGPTNLGRLAAQLSPAVQQAQTGGKELVDHAFWRGLLLVGIVLAAALLYRLLAPRMTALDPKSDSH